MLGPIAPPPPVEPPKPKTDDELLAERAAQFTRLTSQDVTAAFIGLAEMGRDLRSPDSQLVRYLEDLQAACTEWLRHRTFEESVADRLAEIDRLETEARAKVAAAETMQREVAERKNQLWGRIAHLESVLGYSLKLGINEEPGN